MSLLTGGERRLEKGTITVTLIYSALIHIGSSIRLSAKRDGKNGWRISYGKRLEILGKEAKGLGNA